MLKLTLAITLTTALACNNREVVAIDSDSDVVDHTDFALDDNRDVDILVVVDNSDSMLDEQIALGNEFPKIIDALRSDGELPSIHIGVVSTDVGGRACSSGDANAGKLLVTGKNCTGTNDSTPYIFDLVDEDGNRSQNYDGELRDAFTCMAELGTGGCGFEQPLEAVRLALDHPSNQGFFRDHAYLAIIFVTDEDDCSVTESEQLLADLGDRTPAVLSSVFGAFSSYRCFEFGTVCDGPSDPRAPGLRQDCVPRADSPYLKDIDEIIATVRARKQFDNQILVAAIAGDLEPVVVDMVVPRSGYTFEIPTLVSSCPPGSTGVAVPPIRLDTFVAGFPKANRLASICEGDLAPAVDDIVDLFGERFNPCLKGAPADFDPDSDGIQPECSVVEVTNSGTDRESERVLRRCDNPTNPGSSSVLPCYLLVPNAADCSGFPTGLEVAIHYAEGFEVPPGTEAEIDCIGVSP